MSFKKAYFAYVVLGVIFFAGILIIAGEINIRDCLLINALCWGALYIGSD